MSNRKSLLRSGFVVKIIFGKFIYDLRVSPLFVALCLTLTVLSVWATKVCFDLSVEEYRAHIADLEKTNSQYRSALALKEREREQMSALAEQRFDELYSQLEDQDQKLNTINKVVGKSSKNRRGLKGSRSGQRHTAIELKLKYKHLIHAVKNREGDISSLKRIASNYRKRVEKERALAALNCTPSIWPCQGEISSDYGGRIHPIYGYLRFHTGLDLAAPEGTGIVSSAAGAVTYSGWMQGYGYAVIVDHGKGLSTLYAHCSALKASQGQFVKKGQLIALVGSTGNSTGPHCHYEVQVNGQHVNPVPYLSKQ